MPGSPVHLVLRFFDVLTAPGLSPDERDEVRGWLSPGEMALFFDQADHDQRHGYDAAKSVLDAGSSDARVIKAALLHDVGKRYAGLGVTGRSVASVAIALRIPLPPRFATYRDHGEVAAVELEAIGSDHLAVSYARSHHGPRPMDITPAAWALLQAADQPPKPRKLMERRIS